MIRLTNDDYANQIKTTHPAPQNLVAAQLVDLLKI
jgi:hypothetical protein